MSEQMSQEEQDAIVAENYRLIFQSIDNIPTNLEPTDQITKIAEILRLATAFDDGEEGPVLDYLVQHFNANSQQRYEWGKIVRNERARQISNDESLENTEPKRKEPPKETYITFIQSLPAFRDFRRELLSDELMVLDKSGSWQHALNKPQLSYIKSHAKSVKTKFNLQMFEHHMESWRRDELPPKLLIDIPQWDGNDRVRAIARSVAFRNCPPEMFYELICEFGANIFRRLHDNTVQPVTPIFQGTQGCGKDTLIDALTAGLGLYRKPLTVSHRDDEAEQQLHTALLFVIGEFDRTSKMDVSTLKDILNKPTTSCRLKYDAKAETRRVRCSFVASCNIQDIFKDHSGNRRYWLFEAEYLGFKNLVPETTYPGHWANPNHQEERAQIIAQFQHLASVGFQARQEFRAQMQREVQEHTPDDPNVIILEDWDNAVSQLACIPDGGRHYKTGQKLYSLDQIQPVLDTLRCRYQKPQQIILQIIKSGIRCHRTRKSRFYCAGNLCANVSDDSTDEGLL